METGEHELLVHITAPSSALDDKRYVAVAQSVADFRPAIITRVCGPNLDPPSTLSAKTSQSVNDDYEFVSTRLVPKSFQVNAGSPTSHRSNLPRQRTAPQLSSTTDSTEVLQLGRNRRRAPSDTSPIGNSFSAPCKSTVEASSGDLQPGEDGSALGVGSQSQPRPNETTSTPAHPKQKRKKPRTKSADDADFTLLAFSGEPNQNTANAPCSPRTPQKDWSAHGSPADDAGSTQSPSPSHFMGYTHGRTKEPESQQPDTPCLVDLTTPERWATSSYLTPSSRPVHVNHFRTATTSIAGRLASCAPFHAIDDRIRRHPDEVRAPHPQGSQLRFTTHVTSMLEKLAVQIELFRPAFVARDIKVLERGYWQFWVKVAEESIVEESRQPPKATPKLLGSTAHKEHDRAGAVHETVSTKDPHHALWTEKEFIQFWEDVAWVVEKGKAGLGTRFVKNLEGENLWRIRLFTWGEILGHTWILLFALSDKLTAKVLMEWIAADGTVLVRTSSKNRLLGIWKRNGPAEQGGTWGFR